MEFPFFHLDWMGNRLLIAFIGTLHVFINHALAVGLIPLVAMLEYRGYRANLLNPGAGDSWDRLARRVMGVAFVLTTTAGALTGVGIWLSVALVNPAAIGSLTRVFYGAWFTEWIVFVLEVIFIMFYYLGWKRSTESPAAKLRHIRTGAALSLFSWLTMAIIVAILGFMMDPGNWLSARTFLSGVANPLYIPQLYLRTPLALMLGGAVALLMIPWILEKRDPVREKSVIFVSLWLLIWTPVLAAGAFLYRGAIPEAMQANFPTAVTTQAYLNWYGSLAWVIPGTIGVSLLLGVWGVLRPRRLPRLAAAVPLLALLLFLGSFERVREFIRKPFIIGGYMYASGLRVEDYPLYQRDGLLARAVFRPPSATSSGDREETGRHVFLAACSRCHTTGGVNSVLRKFRNLGTPGRPLDSATIQAYIPGMHKAWYYMPPFPGNQAELEALTAYLIKLDRQPQDISGAQREGIHMIPARVPAASPSGLKP